MWEPLGEYPSSVSPHILPYAQDNSYVHIVGMLHIRPNLRYPSKVPTFSISLKHQKIG